jgi:hypothetical protein
MHLKSPTNNKKGAPRTKKMTHCRKVCKHRDMLDQHSLGPVNCVKRRLVIVLEPPFWDCQKVLLIQYTWLKFWQDYMVTKQQVGNNTFFIERLPKHGHKSEIWKNKATLRGWHTDSKNCGGVGAAIQWCRQFLKHRYKWNSRALVVCRLDTKSKNELWHQGLWFTKSIKGGVP